MATADRNYTRRQQSRIVTIAATNASAQWLAGNASRVTLTFSAHATEPFTVVPGFTATLTGGIFVPAGSQAVTFTEREHGDALRGPWSVITAVNPVTLAALETIVVNEDPFPRASPGSV